MPNSEYSERTSAGTGRPIPVSGDRNTYGPEHSIRVKGINELKILLEERLKHKVFKANFMASTDLYQFNNCNHNKFKNEN